ncbi:MAG: glycosyltransferase family 32 protein [Fusobacteriaceae bacterium]
MIPKKIHYCWFGKNEKPEIVKKCIESWKKILTDYEIIEWNETNFDIDCNSYVKEAYKRKKYAFVSDYVRVEKLYKHGGIYLDTDVEVFKSFDEFLDNSSFWGFEEDNYIATSTIGAEEKNPIIEEFLKFYDGRDFSQVTNVVVVTDILNRHGIKMDGSYQKIEGITVYPQEYFSPYDYINYYSKKTEKTVAIHHFYKSWLSSSEKIKKYIKIGIIKTFGIGFLAKLRRFLLAEKWVLAMRKDDNSWKYIESQPLEWEADPFLVQHNGKYYVFYENMKPGKKGTIFVGEVDREKCIIKNKREVLKESFHLSYPNVFKIEDKFYMIPETHEAGKIILYEATDFPNSWKKSKELADISCVDLTFFRENGIYYLFFSEKEEGEHPYCRSLHGYYSEDILKKPILPLGKKLVAEGLDSSRMGGNFLEINGKWYRFSQNCSRRYGENLNIHEVITVSPNLYKESKPIPTVRPEGTLGMHTYSEKDGIEIVDLCIENYRILEKLEIGFRNKIFRWRGI